MYSNFNDKEFADFACDKLMNPKAGTSFMIAEVDDTVSPKETHLFFSVKDDEAKVAMLASILKHMFVDENKDILINEAINIANRSAGVVECVDWYE